MAWYRYESRQGAVKTDSDATVLLSGVTDNLRLFRVFEPITVTRIGFIITTATTVTAPIVDWDKRVVIASDAGRVDKAVGTMTFPVVADGAIGNVIYKDITPVDLDAGNEICVQVTTAATAGAGIPFLVYHSRSEVPGNQTKMKAAT